MTSAGQFGPYPFIDSRGNALPAVEIAIYDSTGTTLASLYSDRARTPLANPLPTGVADGIAGVDTAGNAIFWADADEYLMVVRYGGTQRYQAPITISADPDDANAVLSVNGRSGIVIGLAENADLVAEAATARANEGANAAAIATEASTRATQDGLLIPLTQRGAANGVATLDAGSKVPTAQLPALAITETFPVASQAAMLALTAQRGDVAIRTDLNKSFILSTDSPTTLADWKELLTPTDAVTSVNARVGVVSGLAEADASNVAASAAAWRTAIGAQAAGTYLSLVEEEGTSVGAFSALDFRGASVTVTDAGGGVARVTITDATLTQEQVEDFVGALVQDSSVLDATYDDAGGALTITIKAGVVTNAMLAGAIARTKLADRVVNTQTTSYTLVLADAEAVVRTNAAGANIVTVPLNATVAFPTGTEIEVVQGGAGATTLAGATGAVTINAPGGLTAPAQYARGKLVKVDTDTWNLTWVAAQVAIVAGILQVNGVAVTADNVSAASGLSTAIWIGAKDFLDGYEGTPTLGLLNTAIPAWLLDADAIETVVASLRVPSTWTACDIDVWVAQTTAGTGSLAKLVMRYALTSYGDAVVPALGAANATFFTLAGVVNQIKVATIVSAAAVDATKIQRLAMGRGATSANDTKTGDVALIGVMLRKV